MKEFPLRCVAICMSVLLLASCMTLGSSGSPETRYYLLESPSVPMDVSSPLPAGIFVGIGPVTIPPYLDRPQMVTRLSGNRMRVDEFNRWGEPLQGAIARVILENVSSLTGSSSAVLFPWKRSLGVDAQVTVEVLRFEADGNGNVTLEARWQLLAEGGKKRISDQRTRMTRNSRSDYSQVVGAMNELLTELSQKISSALVDEFPTQ